MSVRFNIKKLVSLLPESMSTRLLVKLSKWAAPPKQLIIKVADTEEEYKEAFRILHDAYVDVNFMAKNEERMRLSYYHALPHAHLLVAYWQGEIIGTVSIVIDSEFGLPSDLDFNLDKLRHDKRKTIAEISSLAIDKKYRGDRASLHLPLIKFINTYCEKHLNISTFLIATAPVRSPMYKAILGFEDLDGQVIADPLVNNQKIKCLYLDLEEAKLRAYKKFSHLKDSRNLYSYFYEQEFSENLIYPDSSNINFYKLPISEELLTKIINSELKRYPKESPVHQKLKSHLQSQLGFLKQRSAERLPIIINNAKLGNGEFVKITELSKFGGRILINNSDNVAESQIHLLKVQFNNLEVFDLKIQVKWKTDEYFGFEIIKPSNKWLGIFEEEINNVIELKKTG